MVAEKSSMIVSDGYSAIIEMEDAEKNTEKEIMSSSGYSKVIEMNESKEVIEEKPALSNVSLIKI